MSNPPVEYAVSELLDECPRCGGVGCKECDVGDSYGWTAPFTSGPDRYDSDDRRFVDGVDDPLGPSDGGFFHPDDVEDEDADESYGARLARGFAMLAEGDDSIGED